MENLTQWIGADPFCFPDFQKTNASSFDHRLTVQPAMMVFRKEFGLDVVPEELTATYTGDCKFRIFLNGQFFDDGPAEIGGDYANTDFPQWWFVLEKNTSGYLKRGKNVIVIQLLNVPEAQTDYSTGHTGISMILSSGAKVLLKTDPSWKVTVNPGYCRPGIYDANQELDPASFLPDFDDSLWSNAVLLPPSVTKFWKTSVAEIPPLFDREEKPAAVRIPFPESAFWLHCPEALTSSGKDFLSVRPGPPVVIFLEFAEEITGHLLLDVESNGGSILKVEFQETPGCKCTEGLSYVTGKGRRQFRSTRMYPAQYLKLTVQCMEGDWASGEPLKIYGIGIARRGYPFGKTADFHCSDPDLMMIRDTVDRTMRLCCQRLHLDSPVHQEGLGCTGDYVIEALIEQALYGETDLTKMDIQRTVNYLKQKNGFMFHTSYSLLFFDMVHDWFLWTGDTEFLKTIIPVLESVLARFETYLGRTGLISNAPNYLFIDWVKDGGSNYHHPPAERGMGPMTAFFYRALTIYSSLTDAAGQINRFSGLISAVRQAFNRELWDSARQCYRDGIPHLGTGGIAPWCPPDLGETAWSVQTNALALAYSLVPEEKRDALLKKIMTDRSLVQPQMYFCHYVFEAIRAGNAFDRYGYSLLKRWLQPVREHKSSLKENWDWGDYSHAWGGTPAYQIVRSIFGVEPLSPGWSTVRLHPAFGDLTWAEGEIPTPRGMMRICWNGSKVSVRLPPDVTLQPEGCFPVECEDL